MSAVPSITAGDNEGYLQKLEKAMDEQGIIPHRYLRVSEAVYCLWNGIYPLSKGESHSRMLTPKIWQEIQDYPYSKQDMLETLKYGNKYYTGIETEKGVLLFSRDSEGTRQSHYYLQRIADTFFDPDFSVHTLDVYELHGWPSLMEGKVNLCSPDGWEIYQPNEIPLNAYMDKPQLKGIIDSENYDLAATWENYHSLTDGETGLNLANSADNYDCMTLLFIKEQGYPKGGMSYEYPNEFRFDDHFEEIEHQLSRKTMYDSLDDVQKEAKELAVKLLKEHFPDIRQNGSSHEVKHVVPAPNIATQHKGIKL